MRSSKKLKIGIIGASGRMGLEVKSMALAMEYEIRYELTSKNFMGFIRNLKNEAPDVWIDFSRPVVLEKFMDYLAKNPAPLVSGTTGITNAQLTRLKKLAKKSPVFWAPNMSVGIAIVSKMLEAFSGYSDFDFQIDEVHHRHKKDKPSGTALLLQNKLVEVTGRRTLPAPLSTRAGGVYGIHRVQAFSDEEIIAIEHTALNRQVFAKGAIWAAQQIIHYKAGYFEMKDILKV